MPNPTPNRALSRGLFRLIFVTLTLTWLYTTLSDTAFAATITVNGTGDGTLATLVLNATCDLREAIEAANTNAIVGQCPAGQGGVVVDVITLAPSTTINLAAGQLTMNSNVTINANGSTLQGGGNSRVLQIDPGATVIINNLTVTGGGNNAGNPGGGVRNNGGNVTFTSSTITANTTTNTQGGGGISNENGGVLVLDNTTVSNNTAPAAGANGGGLLILGGAVTVQNNSTITGNSANSKGGGIANQSSGALTITNSTISGNSATSGGGIYNDTGALSSGTASISGNTPNNLVNNGGPTLTIRKKVTPAIGSPSFAFSLNDPNTANNPDSTFTLADGGSTTAAALFAGSTYEVREVLPSGWQLKSVVCTTGTATPIKDANNNLIGAAMRGDAGSCLFENVQRGTLIVVQEDGLKSGTDFPVTVSNSDPNNPYNQTKLLDDPQIDDGDSALKSQTFSNVPVGPLTLAGNLPSGWYTELIVCSDGTRVIFGASTALTMNGGQTLTCTLYNRSTTSQLKLLKLPLRQTVGEGDNVNFSIYATNLGALPLTNVDIVDALCDGDPRFAPRNSIMDPSDIPNAQQPGDTGDVGANRVMGGLPNPEIWRYDCVDQNVGNQDYVNTATASAVQNGMTLNPPVTANATANITVRKRGIDIEKRTASGSTIALQGSNVKFILEVRNTSQQDPNSLADNFYAVTVTDLKCSTAPTYVSGDNGNGALEPTETWLYECTTTNVTSDFINEARVDACTGNVALAACESSNYDIWYDRDYLDMQVVNPDLEIEKTPHDQTVRANSSVNFDITLRNLGDQTLSNVLVQDLMCDGGAPVRKSDLIGNNDNLLQVGEIWRYSCNVTNVGEQDTTNRVTVTATDPHNNTVSDYDDVRIDVIHPQIDLEKKPDPLLLLEGQTANFALEVKNTGDQPLTAVTVVDAQCDATLTPLTAPVSGDNAPLGQLDPGETWLYQCSMPNVTADFVNRATVTAKDLLNNVVTDEDTAAVDVLGRGIDLEKQSATPIALQGKAVKFTLEVQNTGQAPLVNVKVSDSKCDAPNNPIPGPVSGDLTNLGVLDPNETWVYECTTSDVQASFVNYAVVTASDGVNAVDDDDLFDIKVVNPKIFLEKLPKSASVLQGSDVPFTLNVRNWGDQNLTITTFSDPLCAKPPLYVSGDDGDTVLEPGEIWKYTCTVTNVQSDFTNVALVKAKDPNGIEVQDTEDAKIHVVNAGIDLQKLADTPQIFQGQTAKFTLKVTKTGVENLRSIDIIDAQCGWAEHTNPNNPADTPTSGDSNNNGLLESGETWIYACSIPNAVADFTNSARVKAREVNSGVEVQATASAAVDVLNPGINVEKSAVTPIVAQGATVKFLITVQNTGQADLSNLVLQDALCVGGQPTPIFGGFGLLQPTEKWQYECSVTDVQNDFDNTVTVSALDPIGNQVNHNATAHVDVVNPAIDLEKTPSSQTILAGGKAQFTLRIKNTGELDLHNILLTDALCDGGAPTVVSKGDNDANNLLKPNEVWEYNCVRSAVQADFTNTASVTALDPTNRSVGDTESALVKVIQPGLSLNKRPATQAVLKGGTATFFLDVTNTGNATLSKVTVSDLLCSAAPTLVSGDNNSDGKLNPGETWIYSCARTNVVEDFTNLASVIFADETGQQLTRTALAEVDVINSGIDLEKSANNTTLLKGQSVKFTLTVLNTGQAPLTVTEIKDPLCDAAPLLVNNGNGDAVLAPAETWLYECTKSNLQSGFTNVASVKAVDANNNLVSDIDDLAINVLNPAIDLEKTPEYQAVIRGSTVKFTLEVRNNGDQVLKNLLLTDAQCTTKPSFLGGDTNDDSLLQPSEIWRYECTVTNVTTNFTNVASVTAQDSNNNTVSDTEAAVVEVVDPGIDLQKVANEPTIFKGETANFTIIVRNTGNQPLQITALSDPLCDAAPVLVGGDANNNGKLDLTEFWLYTCAKANVQADFINTATVTADDGNGHVVKSSDTAAIDVINPGLDLEMSAGSQTVQQGQNAAFTIAVRNTGQADLTNVVVTAALCNIGPTYITFSGAGNGNVDGVLQPGEVWLYSCIKLNVQASFVNVASVTAKELLGGNTVSDQDQASVDVVKVGMNVKMQASSLVVDSGDAVEFTIVVRNTGESALHNIAVTADTCTPAYQSGDVNNDQILQTTEVWVYGCNLGAVTGASATTVTVSGQDANGNTFSSQDTLVITTLDPEVVPQPRTLFLPLVKRQ